LEEPAGWYDREQYSNPATHVEAWAFDVFGPGFDSQRLHNISTSWGAFRATWPNGSRNTVPKPSRRFSASRMWLCHRWFDEIRVGRFRGGLCERLGGVWRNASSDSVRAERIHLVRRSELVRRLSSLQRRRKRLFDVHVQQRLDGCRCRSTCTCTNGSMDAGVDGTTTLMRRSMRRWTRRRQTTPT
jgi:hypothetical protein